MAKIDLGQTPDPVRRLYRLNNARMLAAVKNYKADTTDNMDYLNTLAHNIYF